MKETKECPKCKTENPVAANYCRHCRYEFLDKSKGNSSLLPSIQSLSVRENEYVIGSVVHLDWSCENYSSLELNGKPAPSSSGCEFTVEKPQEITLVAENEFNKTTKKISIKPQAKPVIRKFTANHVRLKAGEKVELTWNVENAVSVQLVANEKSLDVTGRNFLSITPCDNTRYLLRCFSVDPNVGEEKVLEIFVASEVCIDEFTVEPGFVYESEQVRLSWKVRNAEDLLLLPNYLNVTGRNEITLSPSASTEYCLVASNSISQSQQMVAVTVKKMPNLDLQIGNSMSGLEIPSFDFGIDELLPDIKELKVDRLLSGQEATRLRHLIRKSSILKRLTELLKRPLAI